MAGGEGRCAGAGFASALVELDLIDEYRQFISPVVLGGGTPYFPALDRRLGLELLETKKFGFAVVYVRYARRREGRGLETDER